MYRPSRGGREEGELFGPGWLEEAFGLRPDREESPEPRPSEPEGTNAEVEEYRDLLQRLQADFVNYKRRVEQEREEQTRSANRELILKLLPTLDDFARALGPVPQEMADAEWVKGIALIQQKLMATLEEAELHAEEDRRRREEVETRNHADNLAYTTEKTLREVGDRLQPELRSEAEGKVAALRSALQSADTYQVKRAMEELEAVLQRVGQAVYSHAGSGAYPGGEHPGGDGEGTVEGEFREV